ncbi:17258_t:CDS:1, partial [Gigaspora rosea]
ILHKENDLKIGKTVQNNFNNKISQLIHSDNEIQLKSLTLEVNNQNWILEFGEKNEILEQKKRQLYVRVMD